MKKGLLQIVFVLCSVILGFRFLYCQQSEFSLNLPKINRKVVVLIEAEMLINGATVYQPIGTGFLFVTDKWSYVVTAKHIIISTKRKDKEPEKMDFIFDRIRLLWHAEGYKEEIPMIIHVDLNKAYVSSAVYLSDRDIVAIKTARFLGDGTALFPPGIQNISQEIEEYDSKLTPRTTVLVMKKDCISFEEIELTADVIFFGFPSSLRRFPLIFGGELQFDPEWPLFRKGMIAGKNKSNRTLIIDGEVHEGNSGGPVFQIIQDSPTQKKFKLIGLITEFVPYVSISRNERGLPTSFNIQNAGYSIVEPIDKVVELIESNEKKSD